MASTSEELFAAIDTGGSMTGTALHSATNDDGAGVLDLATASGDERTIELIREAVA